jgi:FtsP/CotA-like multicopper oxidase with cupredoxin domain
MMKRRRFLQLAAGAAAGAVIRPASGQEVFMTIGDRKPGPRETLRVRCGERVLFHFRHAGASEDVLLHLPGHRFTVIALDGIAVPTRAAVDVLSLTAGERIDAMVEMNAPGNWLLGSLDNVARAAGLGIVVGYENYDGPARWLAPAAVDWHYARFSAAGRLIPKPDQMIEMVLENQWILDGQPIPDINDLNLGRGRRYRLRMMNATARPYPVHLRRGFELTRVNQIPVSGIFKDTVRLDGYSVVEADVAG